MKYIKFLFTGLFLLLPFSHKSIAIKLDYSNEAIVDDAIKDVIKHPKPTTIKKDVLDKMTERLSVSSSQKLLTFQDITELDFSSNFLTTLGAIDIFSFLLQNKNEFRN